MWFECVESNFDYADESAEAGQEHLLPAPSCPAQGANFKLDGERTIMISLSLASRRAALGGLRELAVE